MDTASTRSMCATAWCHSSGEVVSQRETPLILPLRSTQAGLELPGGKGPSLGRALAGLPPPGDSTSLRWPIVACEVLEQGIQNALALLGAEHQS